MMKRQSAGIKIVILKLKIEFAQIRLRFWKRVDQWALNKLENGRRRGNGENTKRYL